MKPVLCLLPSPLLSAAYWRPVAEKLAESGWPVAGPVVWTAPPRTGDDVLRTLLAAVPDDRATVLVAHSNAGLFVPAITAQRGRVAGYVFTDAGLPEPAKAATTVPMIPPEFHGLLAGKADESGMLPPWTQWWDEADVSSLFPDDETRAEIERDQHRLPLSYFAEAVPVPPGWPAGPGAYLAFGDAYASERAVAEAMGWPVRFLPGEHLHMLVDPAGVAAAIAGLTSAITASVAG